MKIKFLGAAGTVTGSSYLVEYKDKKFIVDCGMFQGDDELEERNKMKFDFNPSEIDFVFLTHAHLDHAGLLPKLVRNGFRGLIFATYPTKDLSEIMLLDSAKVQYENLRKQFGKNRKSFEKSFKKNKDQYISEKQLIYTTQDSIKTLARFRGVSYDKEYTIGDDVRYVYREAGHILGSALIELYLGDEKVVFSGDLGHKNKFLTNNTYYPTEADYVLVESTYGNRLHQDIKESEKQFFDIIDETINAGGNVVIPSFAVERTQELLYLTQRKKINEGFDYPVYMDSPMALKATDVFSNYINYFNPNIQEFNKTSGGLFEFENLNLISDYRDSISLKRRKGAIIIAGSGMCTGGRILYHLKNNLSDPKTTILFVGYQADGTLGRKILDGDPEVEIDSTVCKVRSNIKYITGFSAHADQSDLVSWINAFDKTRLKNLFLVHGELDQQLGLKAEIAKRSDIKVTIPSWKEEFIID
ncbi:MBL fold metallo-hydrolase [Candidatus Dojkabacteria bacterium]|uniref:MBL fold metallo-hydrolase n=1 Tax=Candidatus Dojkabacteria bacterium TaxID=2099670 RepID=A0A955L3U6_9BACT|nr:MBL fold metallo-hydrolase [Candidatus Dojkabacteria bacterium]